MKIVLFINTNVGGGWTIDPVNEMLARGHEVLVCVADEPGNLDIRMAGVGAKVLVSQFDKKGVGAVPGSWLSLKRAVEEFEPDVLVYYLYKASLFGRTIGAVLKIPTVHVIVGPIFLELALTRILERLMLRMDSHVLAGSNAIDRMVRGLGHSDVSVVYPPCDLERFAPQDRSYRDENRRELGIEKDAFVVVMVAFWYAPRVLQGNMKHSKGHDVLLRAWARRKRSVGDRLVIVGGGFREEGINYRKEFLAEFADYIDESVQIVDTVADPRPYYSAADVSIAPSITENLGSAAEAAAMGVPSIASRTGGLPEIVIPGFNGWLVPVGDELRFAAAIDQARAAKRRGSLTEMGHRSRLLAESLFEKVAVSTELVDAVERTAACRILDSQQALPPRYS